MSDNSESKKVLSLKSQEKEVSRMKALLFIMLSETGVKEEVRKIFESDNGFGLRSDVSAICWVK